MDEFEKFFDSITPAGSYDAHDPTHRALRYTQEIAWRAGREAGMREARAVLESCRTVLGNMALENDGAIFNRWPISHEPLRNDARHLLPLIDAILAAIGEGE